MKLKPKITIADHFNVIEDPRIDRTKRHNLIEIMTIANSNGDKQIFCYRQNQFLKFIIISIFTIIYVILKSCLVFIRK